MILGSGQFINQYTLECSQKSKYIHDVSPIAIQSEYLASSITLFETDPLTLLMLWSYLVTLTIIFPSMDNKKT